MSSTETLALLCAGSTRYHDALGSCSTSDRLSRAEIAGLLSGLNEEAVNLALAKYAGDLSAERRLMSLVRLWAVDVALREDWKIVRGRPTVVNMAALAVFEVVRPNRCKRCNGCGFVGNKVCLSCSGMTTKPLSGRSIAECLGIDEAAYRKLWKVRYDLCFNHVQAIDCEVNRVVRKRDNEVSFA